MSTKRFDLFLNEDFFDSIDDNLIDDKELVDVKDNYDYFFIYQFRVVDDGITQHPELLKYFVNNITEKVKHIFDLCFDKCSDIVVYESDVNKGGYRPIRYEYSLYTELYICGAVSGRISPCDYFRFVNYLMKKLPLMYREAIIDAYLVMLEYKDSFEISDYDINATYLYKIFEENKMDDLKTHKFAGFILKPNSLNKFLDFFRKKYKPNQPSFLTSVSPLNSFKHQVLLKKDVLLKRGFFDSDIFYKGRLKSFGPNGECICLNSGFTHIFNLDTLDEIKNYVDLFSDLTLQVIYDFSKELNNKDWLCDMYYVKVNFGGSIILVIKDTFHCIVFINSIKQNKFHRINYSF